jgi:Arc/MetJ family transcription regulator
VTDLATPSRSQIRVQADVDAELLLEAQRQIGAATPDLAIDEALRRLVDQERAKRDAARKRLQEMYAEGDLDFDPVDEPGQ